MTLKELEEFCNGLGFDEKIGQCGDIENALYCDLGNDYDGLTVIYAPPGNEYVYRTWQVKTFLLRYKD